MPFNANCPGCGSLDPCNCGNKPQSNEIKYVGPNLSCTGIQTCDDMSTALQKIDQIICVLQAAITPTTTTSTTSTSSSTTTTTTTTINT
jgi:hypothetical protein